MTSEKKARQMNRLFKLIGNDDCVAYAGDGHLTDCLGTMKCSECKSLAHKYIAVDAKVSCYVRTYLVDDDAKLTQLGESKLNGMRSV